MSTSTLVRYIQMVLNEIKDACVPTQLLDSQPEDLEAEVNEFSGCGAIAGYTAPLGVTPDMMGRTKEKKIRT